MKRSAKQLAAIFAKLKERLYTRAHGFRSGDIRDLLSQKDSPIERDRYGDYVLYHGTSNANAAKILRERRVKASKGWGTGFALSPGRASIYGSMKSMKDKSGSTVLRLVVKKEWMEKGRVFRRETGGSGWDQFLVTGDISPKALRRVEKMQSRYTGRKK
jgi:hypothetical protein